VALELLLLMGQMDQAHLLDVLVMMVQAAVVAAERYY